MQNTFIGMGWCLNAVNRVKWANCGEGWLGHTLAIIEIQMKTKSQLENTYLK